MAEVILDRGTAVFIGMELEKIRAAVKEDIQRYDVYPADRRDLHILEDALNVVIKQLGAQRPNKQGRELGYPQYVVVAEWDDALDVVMTDEKGLADVLASFEDNPTVTLHAAILSTNEPVTAYKTPELAPPEVADERRREVEQRKREIAAGDYKRKHGNAPNFKVGV